MKTSKLSSEREISEVQPQSPVKDKSPWRKSNLNVPNTTEQTELDVRRLRRLKSRSSIDTPSSTSLQSINEEEKRKEVIRTLGDASLPEDSLPVYIRCPSDPQATESQPITVNKLKGGKMSPLLSRRGYTDITDRSPEEQNLPPFAPRRARKTEVSDKVEIDSDNIETPPASRKIIRESQRCSRLKDEDVREEEEPLGDGQFDRFAASRRTLRYRKPVEEEPAKRVDLTSPELVPEKQVIKPQTQQAQSIPVEKLSPKDTESRLRKWQDKLKSKFDVDPEEEAIANITKSGEELQKLTASATLPRAYRRSTSVDPKDVLEAIGKQLKETTSEAELNKCEEKAPEVLNKAASSSTLPRYRRRTNIDQADVSRAVRRFSNGQINEKTNETQKNSTKTEETATKGRVNQENVKISTVKSDFIPEIRVHMNTPVKVRTEHELNDEGFEETQSLVSETPSQGASSGNCEGDFVDSPKPKSDTRKLLRADSSGSGDTSSGINVKDFKRTSSMRTNDKKSVIPRRSTSLRKSDSQSSLTRQHLLDKKATIKPENTPAQRRILALANKQHSRPAVLKSDSNIIQTPRTTAPVKQLDRNLKNSTSAKSPHCVLPKKKVERSSSKSSLRSSRSSLNSSTSVSTVRNVRPMPEIKSYTKAIKNLTSELKKEVKKPLGQAQAKAKASVPASRSSSSGSSIGPVVRRPRVASGVSTSFKENSATIPASRSSSSGESIGPVKKTGLNFMRPTASSSAKDSIDSSRLRSTLRSIK